MLRKIGQNFQIALPREIVKALGLKINDYLDIQVQNNKLVIEPQLVIPKDQAYFYKKNGKKMRLKLMQISKRIAQPKQRISNNFLTNLTHNAHRSNSDISQTL